VSRLLRIELRAAGVRFGRHWAVRELDFDLRAGERWLLVGANGSGKTVLLKLLRGDLWPTPTGRDTRRYHFGDGDVQAQPLFAFERIAYLGPERQDRYERHETTLDVAQTVLTGYDDSDHPLVPATAAQRRRIARVLAGVGLDGFGSRPFRELSYGERRRVLLARALVRRPDALLLDEALNGLDAAGRRDFMAALARAVPARTAWMLSSHRRQDVPGSITHVARLEAGRLVSTQVMTGAEAGAGRLARVRRVTRAKPSVQPAAATPLLELQRATVFRGGRRVLGPIDWTLERGEHWRVTGANGAGKSTFLALLYGDFWPAHGGRLVRDPAPVEDWKQGVAWVSPELHATYAATGCTVEEIVVSGLHASIGLNQPPRADELRRARRAMRAWGVDALAARRARELSYGQLRRALLARAWVRPRRLYLLDEPCDGLDAATRDDLHARLHAALSQGATLVIATHHDEDVPQEVRHELRLRLGTTPVATSR
jgi:molybdate transport system ATP-binding protein